MPVYRFKAITDKGQIVRNKVEDVSRQSLIKKLKSNGLTPVKVVQTGYKSKSQKKTKKNMSDIQSTFNAESATVALTNVKSKTPSFIETINLKLAETEKITERDLMIFSQNFYLLKKANFNNIHALNTIIQSTENLTLRGVLQDILAGVEGRRIYVYHNGVLFKYIPSNLYKHDKSRRAIRIINNITSTSCALSR